MKKELLDWVETQTEKNMTFRIGCLDHVRSEANTTLSILLAGAGACFVLAINNWGEDCRLVTALIGTTVYLFSIGGVLVLKALLLADVLPPTNEPKNLYQPEAKLDEIREAEIWNAQERITAMTRVGNQAGNWLNFVRMAAVVTPLIFLLIWWVSA